MTPRHKYAVYAKSYAWGGEHYHEFIQSATTKRAAWFNIPPDDGQYMYYIEEIDWENEKSVLGVKSKQAVCDSYNNG